MQVSDLLKYIKNPTLLEKQSIIDLQKLTIDFPYFQSAHLLLSMASKKWDASIYQKSLKKTAIVATNRAHLFNLIHQLENTPATELETIIPPVEKKPEPELITEAELIIEDQKQELAILKATDVVTENKNEEPIVVTEKTVETEAFLEKEIEQQVVVSFIEKEVLKTPELHQAKTIETHPENFSDWLMFLKKNNGQSYSTIEQKVNDQKEKNLVTKNTNSTDKKLENKKTLSKLEKNKALIDKIIEVNPGIIRNKEEPKFYAPDTKAKESLIENEHLVTETLAKIYALQGSVNKAVRAYEILSLKFPQKSAYFATLIQKLKNNQ